jgi:predicted esterase
MKMSKLLNPPMYRPEISRSRSTPLSFVIRISSLIRISGFVIRTFLLAFLPWRPWRLGVHPLFFPSSLRVLCVLCGFSLFLTGCHGSQDYSGVNADMNPHTGFVRKEATFGPRDRVYTIFLPNDYSPIKKWPTIVFLHGWAQGGHGGVSAVDSGLGPYILRHKKTFPFIAIFPQSADGWWTDEKDQDDAIRILGKSQQEYSIDPDRVTLMGISNGGHGAYLIGSRYREWFSSIVPMCGNAELSTAQRLAPVPTWIFHYSTDPMIWSKNSQQMFDALEKAGGHPKYTKVPGFGHYVWEDAIGEKLLTWMSAQSRGQWAQTPTPKSTAPLHIRAKLSAASNK